MTRSRWPALGWWLVLGVFPVSVVTVLLPMDRHTTAHLIPAVGSAWSAVAVRAVVAIAYRDRSWSWVIYLLAYPVLLLLTVLVAEREDFGW